MSPERVAFAISSCAEGDFRITSFSCWIEVMLSLVNEEHHKHWAVDRHLAIQNDRDEQLEWLSSGILDMSACSNSESFRTNAPVDPVPASRGIDGSSGLTIDASFFLGESFTPSSIISSSDSSSES